MFCPKCGEKLQDGTRFCGACGAEITSEATQAMETAAPEAVSGEKMVSHKKKTLSLPIDGMSKNKLIGIAAIAAVIIIAILAISGLSSGSGSSNAYAYLSDGNYGVVTNIGKGDTIEVSSGRNVEVSEYNMEKVVAFSSDGKYMYYLTKYDSDNYTGTLCRAEYGKFKEGSSKNDDYITIIDTDVIATYDTLGTNSVIYRKDDVLYYYDGKESIKIVDEVKRFFTDGQDRIMYATGGFEDGYTLYSVSTNDLESKTKIASNIQFVRYGSTLDDVLYLKKDGDDFSTLYSVNFGEEPQKLGEGVFFTQNQIDGNLYFTADSGTTLNMYDYVNDDYADSDANLVEPVEEDFYVTEYNYEGISVSAWGSEEDYPKENIYVSLSREVPWFYMHGPKSSMQDLDESWYSNSSLSREQYDTLKNLMTQFIDKYSHLEDENGYIHVTDEMKQDLMEMNNLAPYSSEIYWLRFCLEKKEAQVFDEVAYQEACDKWDEATVRISVREYLQDRANAVAVKDLYVYKEGTVTTLAENVLDTKSCGHGVLYNTVDMITEKIDIDEISNASIADSIFDISPYAQNYVLLVEDDTICQMSEEAAEAYGEAYENEGGAMLYFHGDDVLMRCNSENSSTGKVLVSKISDGKVGDFTTILSDDALVRYSSDGKLCYETNYYTSGGKTYGDFYTYENGESTLLLTDILGSGTLFYRDGSILAFSDANSNESYEITILNKNGKETIVDKDITLFSRLDESTAMYISDGDLYFYDGKESSLVKSEVDYFWCKDHYSPTYTDELYGVVE